MRESMSQGTDIIREPDRNRQREKEGKEGMDGWKDDQGKESEGEVSQRTR